MVQRSPVALLGWRAGAGWPFVFASDGMGQFGFAPDELLWGHFSWSTLIHPEDWPQFQAEWAARISRGDKEFSSEYRILSKSGETHWVEMRTVALGGVHGRSGQYHTVLDDITRRREAEKRLKEAEAKCRMLDVLQENMLDGVVIMSVDGRILDCNSICQRLFGLEREELLGKRWREIMPWQWRSAEQRLFQEEAFPKGGSGLLEMEVRRKDGSSVPIELRLFLDKDEQGRNRGIWAIVRDITKRKRAEEASRRSERNYREIFEAANDAMFIHDMDTCRRIVELHGGTVGIESELGRGSTFYFDLPRRRNEDAHD